MVVRDNSMEIYGSIGQYTPLRDSAWQYIAVQDNFMPVYARQYRAVHASS